MRAVFREGHRLRDPRPRPDRSKTSTSYRFSRVAGRYAGRCGDDSLARRRSGRRTTSLPAEYRRRGAASGIGLGLRSGHPAAGTPSACMVVHDGQHRSSSATLPGVDDDHARRAPGRPAKSIAVTLFGMLVRRRAAWPSTSRCRFDWLPRDPHNRGRTRARRSRCATC